MIRTYAQQDVEDLAKYGSISIINGLTDLLHPCQILADFQTIYEHKGRLKGKTVCYVGDGNNISNSLLYGCTKLETVDYPVSIQTDSNDIFNECTKLTTLNIIGKGTLKGYTSGNQPWSNNKGTITSITIGENSYDFK